jgi:hypothetical protein
MKIYLFLAGVFLINALAVADPAPDINLVDLEGNWHNMNKYVTQGKYIAYDFVTLD